MASVGVKGLRTADGILFTGRAAFIGLGFTDRGDSFDLLVSIQDHFKYVSNVLLCTPLQLASV